MPRRLALPLVLVVLGLAVSGSAVAVTEGSPSITVHLPDNRVAAGDETTLELTLLNSRNITSRGPGNEESQVTIARNLTVSVDEGDAPIEVLTATQAVGTVPEGRVGPFRFRITVDETAEPGTYAVPVILSYNHTSEIDSSRRGGVRRETDGVTVTRTVKLIVEPRARFVTVSALTTAYLGETGSVRVTMENVGSATAHDATVSLRSTDPTLTFAGSPTADVFVGDWAPGERRTVTVDSRLAGGSGQRSIPLVGTVAFDDPDGTAQTSEALNFGVTPAPGAGRFPVMNTSADFVVGESGTLQLQLRNAGETQVVAASVTVQSLDQALTLGGRPTATAFIREWGAGETRNVSVAAGLADGVDVRSYPVVVTVEYRTPAGESHQAGGVTTGVTPAEGPGRFPVVNASADIAVGETGTVEVNLRNAGSTPVSDARVTIQSDDPALTFGGGPAAATFAGEWAPGEVRTAAVSARIADGADARPYPLSVTVQYRDGAGAIQQSKAVTTGVTPRVEQTFGLANITSTLAVGDEGTLRGTITNTGPTLVRNAVVVFSAENVNVVPIETEYAIGDLDPGETATFAFDVEVSDSADAGPRQLSFVVRFRDAGDDVRRSDPLDARVEVAGRQDVFTLEPVTEAISAGESTVLELRVTNAGAEVVTDVSAKLFADDPLSSADDEAFIDRLGPGESTTIRFELTAAGDAVERKVYPVSLDFQYDDAEGDTRLSDTYDVPVRVSANQGADGPPVALVIGVVLVALVLVAGFWYWRRR